jgi:hypothetical protein
MRYEANTLNTPMKNDPELKSSAPKVGSEDEMGFFEARWFYTRIGFLTSKEKILYYGFPTVLGVIAASQYGKHLIDTGAPHTYSVAMVAVGFAAWIFSSVMIVWAGIGKRYFDSMGTCFGPKTRAGLWDRFYRGEHKHQVIDVVRISREVGEYDPKLHASLG